MEVNTLCSQKWISIIMIRVNRVLVRPDGDHTTSSGFFVPTEEQEQLHWSISGTVVEVPDDVFFFGKKAKRLLKKRCQHAYKKARRLAGMSLQYGTEMELKPGDRVIYLYSAKYEPDTKEVDGCLVMDYDMLIAKQTPDGWRPLNGFLLVSMLQKEEEEEILPGITIKNDDRNVYGQGVVKYVGSNISGYRDYKPSSPDIEEGCIVHYHPGLAYRLEVDLHNTLNPDGQSSLFVVNRKDVIWTSTISSQ